MSEPLRPDEMEIRVDGDDIVLDFKADSGESRVVVLSRKWVPTLLARLMQETEPGQMVPIDRASLQIGASFSVQSWQVQRRSDGARRLTLAVDLPDQGRVVTIPLELSAAEVQSLLDQLK
jgi:hypothetical protein